MCNTVKWGTGWGSHMRATSSQLLSGGNHFYYAGNVLRIVNVCCHIWVEKNRKLSQNFIWTFVYQSAKTLQCKLMTFVLRWSIYQAWSLSPCGQSRTLHSHIHTIFQHASYCTRTNQSQREFPDLFVGIWGSSYSDFCLSSCLHFPLVEHTFFPSDMLYFISVLWPEQYVAKLAFCTVYHVLCEVK